MKYHGRASSFHFVGSKLGCEQGKNIKGCRIGLQVLTCGTGIEINHESEKIHQKLEVQTSKV
jgi:hypothetical protein